MPTIYGTDASEIILGTPESDISIFGLGGDDFIYGQDGDDFIWGGPGDDRVHGHRGEDFLVGGNGDDTVFGNDDNDVILGESGNDTLDGGDGDDYINGGTDDDRLIGGNGNDTLKGGLGDDKLIGTNNRHAIEIDELTGGGGADTFRLGDFYSNYYNNGGNSDYALITDMGYLDQIILDNGTYTTGSSPIAGISGTAIYEGSELLAIVQGLGVGQYLSFESRYYLTTATVKSSLTYNPGIFQSVKTGIDTSNLQAVSL
ncbi:MAG: calcium-binding protein [Cyanobacteria bacterium J06627_28]